MWRFKFILDTMEIVVVVIYWQYDNRWYRVYQFSEILAQVLVKEYWEGGRASIGVIAPTNQILCKDFRGTPGNFQDTYLQTQNPSSNRWVYWDSSLTIEHKNVHLSFLRVGTENICYPPQKELVGRTPLNRIRSQRYNLMDFKNQLGSDKMNQ